MVFSVTEATELQKEVSSSGGRFINPSKIDGETRIRLFGEGVTGFEGWTTDNKPVRWESRPDGLPENIRKNDDGRDPLKRFVAAIAWEYDSNSFKIISLTQKGLIKDLMGYIADKQWGDPAGYDIKIARKGEGLQTEYNMMPCPPKSPTKEAADAFAELSCDLSKLFDGEDPFGESL